MVVIIHSQILFFLTDAIINYTKQRWFKSNFFKPQLMGHNFYYSIMLHYIFITKICIIQYFFFIVSNLIDNTLLRYVSKRITKSMMITAAR